MTVLLDTSAVVAYMDRGDPGHDAAVRLLTSIDDDLVTTPLVIAEMDREITARGGRDAAKVLWSNFESGAFASRWWADGLADTVAIARRYPFADLPDASLVALAGIVRTTRIATFDEHFRSMTTPRGEDFVLLPSGS